MAVHLDVLGDVLHHGFSLFLPLEFLLLVHGFAAHVLRQYDYVNTSIFSYRELRSAAAVELRGALQGGSGVERRGEDQQSKQRPARPRGGSRRVHGFDFLHGAAAPTSSMALRTSACGVS